MKLLIAVDLVLDHESLRPPDTELVPCPRDMIVQGLAHQKFYVIVRSCTKLFGPWPVVTINGEERVIDASVPTHCRTLPRDALEIKGDLFERILHNQDGSHSWFGRHLPEVSTLVRAHKALKGHRA